MWKCGWKYFPDFALYSLKTWWWNQSIHRLWVSWQPRMKHFGTVSEIKSDICKKNTGRLWRHYNSSCPNWKPNSFNSKVSQAQKVRFYPLFPNKKILSWDTLNLANIFNCLQPHQTLPSQQIRLRSRLTLMQIFLNWGIAVTQPEKLSLCPLKGWNTIYSSANAPMFWLILG